MKRRTICSFAALGIIAGITSLAAAADAPDAALKAVVADSHRMAENIARDGARHPYETLSFWGLKPNQSVIEIAPGETAYWTEILAAYAKTTGGAYATTMGDETNPKVPEAARKFITEFKARFADTKRFAPVRWIAWDGKAPLAAPGSADMVITARNVHDWMWEDGQLDTVLKAFYDVLKPGGILAVEDHRADPRKQVPQAHDGYVSVAFMKAAVEKAGFKLEASSEVNANPKDTKDYPFGVWTLPPTNTRKTLPYITAWPGQPDAATLKAPAFYQAIGESDRMTLRFRKPN